jgi:hypothetical protein
MPGITLRLFIKQSHHLSLEQVQMSEQVVTLNYDKKHVHCSPVDKLRPLRIQITSTNSCWKYHDTGYFVGMPAQDQMILCKEAFTFAC